VYNLLRLIQAACKKTAFNQLSHNVSNHIIAKRLGSNSKFDHLTVLGNVECLYCSGEGPVRVHPGSVDSVQIFVSDVVVEH